MPDEISSDYIRGYIDPMILCVLLQGPSYGYEVSKRIRQITTATADGAVAAIAACRYLDK